MAYKKMERMALEIAERNTDATGIVLAGIRESGSVIAARLLPMLQRYFSGEIELAKIIMDKRHPDVVTMEPALPLDGKVVIVVDDVANSGKTLTYALKPILSYHPLKIQTLVLVERTHKTFPIQPDHVGLSIGTTLQDHIYVETDGEEVIGAYLA